MIRCWSKVVSDIRQFYVNRIGFGFPEACGGRGRLRCRDILVSLNCLYLCLSERSRSKAILRLAGSGGKKRRFVLLVPGIYVDDDGGLFGYACQPVLFVELVDNIGALEWRGFLLAHHLTPAPEDFVVITFQKFTLPRYHRYRHGDHGRRWRRGDQVAAQAQGDIVGVLIFTKYVIAPYHSAEVGKYS